MSALGAIGEGATGEVYQSRLDLQTEFAFKRSIPSLGSNSISARYKVIISEMIILRHAAIRDNPYIIDLVGIGWDVSVRDQSVWPVLVFPKASFGSLRQFLGSPEGTQVSFHTRIKLCSDMVKGLSTMHFHNIIHGDIKPENVVVTKDDNGLFRLQLIDFGYSCFGSAESDLIYLPRSRPWTAPEHHWRGFPIISAKLMDIYALGMVCAFLILGSMPITSEDYVVRSEYEDDPTKHRNYVVDSILGMLRELTTPADVLSHSLVEFFHQTLSHDVSCRATELSSLLTMLESVYGPGEAISIVVEEAQPITIAPHGVPVLHQNLAAYDWLHYLVRENIFATLQLRASDRVSCDSCWHDAAINLAYCYRAGFGVERDLETATHWFEEVKASFALRQQDRTGPPVVLPPESFLPRHATNSSITNEGLLQRGLLDFSLINLITEEADIGTVIHKIETESRAREAEFGEEYSSTLYFKLLLSTLYLQVGKVDEALAIQNRIVRIYRQQGGVTLLTRQAMAVQVGTLLQLGNLEQAKLIQEELVAEARKANGDKHPDTVQSVLDLAVIKAEMSEYDEAEVLQIAGLEDIRKLFGTEHPRTINAMRSLCSTYCDQGRYYEAESIALEARSLSIQSLGSNNPKTLAVSQLLFRVYYAQDKLDEAEEQGMAVFKGRELLLGYSHPDTLAACANLSTLRLQLDQLNAADKLLDPLYDECKRVLGFGNSITMMVVSNFASLRAKQQRWKEAEETFLEIIDAIKDMFGESNEHLITPMSNLADVYVHVDRLDVAESWQRKALALGENIFKGVHPTVATLNTNLASNLRLQSRFQEAEVLARTSLGQCEQLFGEDHRSTRNTKRILNLIVTRSN
ncbi:hypothetical protein MMC18_009692 [Xylographa bjoerkii]|nr:hypothetical protein [Xylographa bjoerkii]